MIKKTMAYFLGGAMLFTSMLGAGQNVRGASEEPARMVTSVTEQTYQKEEQYGQYFEAFMQFVKSKYKDDVSDEQLLQGAFKGMLSNLDKFSEFFSNEEANSFFGGVEGNYKGIGIVISKDDSGAISVNKVFPDTPALRSGLIEGDKIMFVDGASVMDWSVEEASSKIKGPEGTTVTLKILRGQKEIELIVPRAEVKINPVAYKIVNGIGYIQLDAFNLNADIEMKKALEAMDKNKVERLILDLRNNPGGEVGQAVNISKHFVPKGLITKLVYRDPSEQDQVYYSSLEKIKYKLMVLVNKNSASASEILAGAIQDTQAGTLVGTRTYGKSKVQKVFPILNKESFEKNKKDAGIEIIDVSELNETMLQSFDEAQIYGWAKVSVGEYFTPKGRQIDLKGLEPDVQVENTDEIAAAIAQSIGGLKKEVKFKTGDEGADVLQLERILKLAGYDVDEADALYDAKTAAAVSKFQMDQGMFAYGVADFSTQEKLNTIRETLLQKHDLQYAKALEMLQK